MRDYILIYLNGKRLEVAADDAFKTLSTYLRSERRQTGTKVVCEEGDCGACSVLLGTLVDGDINYRPVNSCIQLMCQLDLTHIVTIEGLTPTENLNPVQEAMVQCHGAQCGYCTPGFVVAMCSVFDQCASVSEKEIKDGLIGNLCRCTGYEPIIKAGLSVDQGNITKLATLYPSQSMVKDFEAKATDPVFIEHKNQRVSIPRRLSDAAQFKAENVGVTVLSGGTDVCVVMNKRGLEPSNILCINKLPDLNRIEVVGDTLVVGALAALSQLEQAAREHLPSFDQIMWLFGSPQIRHAATLAGNIANGSPIGDSIPFLFVMDAEVELVGINGTRRVLVNQLYKGYKQLDMTADELIARVHIPLPKPNEILKLFKVSRRRNLDISTFTAAFRLVLAANGKSVDSARIAYGGVGPVVLRLQKTEDFLTGKTIELQTFVEAGGVALDEITPISDVRGSAAFRNQLAANILQKLYFEIAADKELIACP